MPFKSEAQRRFMYAKHPDIAKRWTREYGQGKLPKRSSKERAMAFILKNKEK